MTQPATILIADDDRSIRTVLTQALGRSGYNVRTTGNAATLWRWVQDGEGDLVITDVLMPDENGLDLVPRMKRVRPDLRIVVMSAQSTILTAVKATQRGAFEYLPKPFDIEAFGEPPSNARSPCRPRRLTQAPVRAPRLPETEQLPIIGRSHGDAGDLPGHRAPDEHRPHRAHRRRIRHRQGTGCTAHCTISVKSQAAGPVRRRQHGGDPARADRERAVRP